MSKQSKKNKKIDLPSLPNKYINERKIEELEKFKSSAKEKQDNLLNELKSLNIEMKEKEADASKRMLAASYKLEEQSNLIKELEKANENYKTEIIKIQEETSDLYSNEISNLKTVYEDTIKTLQNELNIEKEKNEEYEHKFIQAEKETSELKAEINKLNVNLISNIDKYENIIKQTKESYEDIINNYSLKEEQYIKEKETLNENEIYEAYKEIKTKYNKTINESKDIKNENNKLNEQNKINKLTIQTTDNILKECAKIQVEKEEIIKDLKNKINIKINENKKTKDLYELQIKELNNQFSNLLNDLNKELINFKNKYDCAIKENKELKRLSNIILDQRNEIEIYFLESLDVVKKEIYKKKQLDKKKNAMFPNLISKYDDKTKVKSSDLLANKNKYNDITINDLTYEDKEKMLKLLFKKINEKNLNSNYYDYISNKYKQDNININDNCKLDIKTENNNI